MGCKGYYESTEDGGGQTKIGEHDMLGHRGKK